MDRCENWFGKLPLTTRTRDLYYADRFIPYRPQLNVENAHMQILTQWPQKSKTQGVSSEYSRCLSHVFNNRMNILPTHPTGVELGHTPSKKVSRGRSPSPWFSDVKDDDFPSPKVPTKKRHVLSSPDRVLDMPGLRDDFYCNVLDWGANGCIAAALGSNTYVWNVRNEQCKRLRLQLPEIEDFYVSALAWSKIGEILAISTCQGDILLWDAESMKLLREIRAKDLCHAGSLTWSKANLLCGNRRGRISVFDYRMPKCHTKLVGHNRDVTNLKMSQDEDLLASGGDDGILNVWSMRTNCVYRRVFAHHACAKALAWCPWRPSVIASGGGSNDGHIRLWHVHKGEKLAEIDTQSQVCSLLWSSSYHELISSHGLPNPEKNSVQLWQSRLLNLEQTTGHQQHTARPLHLALSPDGTTLASLGADEKMCLWKCFPMSSKRDSLLDGSSPLLLNKSIR